MLATEVDGVTFWICFLRIKKSYTVTVGILFYLSEILPCFFRAANLARSSAADIFKSRPEEAAAVNVDMDKGREVCA